MEDTGSCTSDTSRRCCHLAQDCGPLRAGREERSRGGFGEMVVVVLRSRVSLTTVQSEVVLPALSLPSHFAILQFFLR